MKKIFLAIYLLLIFSTTTANAYTVFVGIDDTIESVVGFYFDVSVPSDSLDLTIYYQGDTITVCGYSIGGAVPPNIFPPIPYPWYIGPLATSPTNAYIGIDIPAVFSAEDNHPLSSGIILSLVADTAFSLNNFILAGVNPEGELYLYDLNIIEISTIEGCIEGGGKGYIYSAVPIPGSLVLLGSGLIGLIGLGRRRMRK